MVEPNTLKEYCLQNKQKVSILLVQELDESLDSIELIKGFKRKGMLSICGIIRVFDYGKQIKDSSIILLIASKDEYQSLVNQKIVRIMGLRFKIIGHDLVMKTVISTKINAPVPDNLIIFNALEVLRPRLSDYLIVELD
ncbi:hypothetical protein PVAND_005133 [Polypedilum vanderplanki]|uniref:Uncharacterized protein n=1 Tax=Polypedilum vanderplanki TaxID=319348 RepID=A0A9J6BYZ9_POLVA|nr:hypothetical protein PVAND_005133 [Polypedilum vanderplanki]